MTVEREKMAPRAVLWIQDEEGAEHVVHFNLGDEGITLTSEGEYGPRTVTLDVTDKMTFLSPNKSMEAHYVGEAARDLADECDELHEAKDNRARLEELFCKLGNEPEAYDLVQLFFRDVLTFRNSVQALSGHPEESVNPDIYSSETLETWALMAREAGYLDFPVPNDDDMEDDEWDF